MTRPPKPERMEVLVGNIPEALRTQERWVLWRWTWNGKKWDKPPRSGSDAKIDPHDSKNWLSFEEALTAATEGEFDGVGFVPVTDDGYVQVDLDDCRDSQSGELTSEAELRVDFLESYAEISPSGRGVKCWVQGTKPGPRCKQGNFEMADKDVTDVGAGGGAQSRAADTHLAIRRHMLDGYAVVEAVPRTFARPEPVSWQWEFPVWRPSNVEPELYDKNQAEKRANDDSIQQAILDAVATKGKILNKSELEKAAGHGGKALERNLEALLEDEDLVELPKEGNVRRFSSPETAKLHTTEEDDGEWTVAKITTLAESGYLTDRILRRGGPRKNRDDEAAREAWLQKVVDEDLGEWQRFRGGKRVKVRETESRD